MPAYVPEPEQGDTQTQGALGLLPSLLASQFLAGCLQEPCERRTQVIMLLLQPGRPPTLLGSLEMRLGLLRECQVIQRMRLLGRRQLSARRKRLQSILTDRFEQQEPWLLLFPHLHFPLLQ